MKRRSYKGHPLVTLAGTVARMPRYLKLSSALLRDPSIPAVRKTALIGGLGYAVLPFDLLPGIIPIVGQLDDLAAVLLGIRFALAGCSPEVAQEHLAQVGLSETAIEADVQTVRDTATWLLKGGARLGREGILWPFRRLLGQGRRSLDEKPVVAQ
jgi:uncharacterized membrane protein YkvA (DUF1232 family)